MMKKTESLKRNPEGLFETASNFLKKGDYRSAREKFRLALIYNPRFASEVALKYEDILSDDPHSVNARLSLADLHLYLGEVDGAIGELEEILDLVPDRADIYNMLGKLYLKLGDIDSVIKTMELAFRSGVKDTNLTEMLAGAYIEKNRIDEAVTLYKSLVAIDPKNKNYFRILGELEMRMGQTMEAANDFYHMIEADPTSVSEVVYKLEDLQNKDTKNIFLKEKLVDAYIKAIQPVQAAALLEDILKIDIGQLDNVISKFRKILDKYPDEPATLKAIARALTVKGLYSEAVNEYCKLIRYSDDNINDAINGFKDVISKFPGQVHAHESLGDAFLKMGKTEEAMLEYLEVLNLNSDVAKSIINKCQKVVKENPNMILAHQILGQAHLLAGDQSSAIEEAEFIIYLNKTHAPAYQILGDAYMKVHNTAKAQNAYASAMKLEPSNTMLHKKYRQASFALINEDIDALKKRMDEDPWKISMHLDIAKLYLMIEDFEKGVRELQAAVKDTARAPFAYNLLGLIFVEMGRFDLAVLQFERSLEMMPKELSELSKAVRFNCAASYEAMGEIIPAISQYETLLSEDVEFGGAQERVKNLASVSPEASRNKLIAVIIEHLGEKSTIGVWGRDMRHTDVGGESLNISFGQDHNNAGFEHFIKGRFKAASEEFSLAAQLDPKFFAALNNLGIMFLKDSRLEQGETRLSFALSLDPDSAVIHNNIAVCHYLKGDLKAAAAELAIAIEKDPGLSAAYINMGDVLYLVGSANNALSMWEKIKFNDPLSPIATRRLAYKTVS